MVYELGLHSKDVKRFLTRRVSHSLLKVHIELKPADCFVIQ